MDESPYARVSDAERERALQELSRHFSFGRLTAPEFDERTSHVWRADTRRQLAEMFADLPAPPALEPVAYPGVAPRLMVRGVAITMFVIVFALALGNGMWLLLLGAIPVVLLIRLHRQ
ncbi:DUF1707 SHOCT-like domain-containing protein [Nocardia sp. NBC_01327]|uniref:DUF1707 SHOCT-like domain-containing protein n=1 Tax=Nocardia sp. NBC_01327 TaxID=2903593 RepID=UPI002E0F6985|nr:DUF1707 domain-containing protein [Nocardia sp. NBC_01327]